MKNENGFVWKYESVLDHGITPEEFKKLTGFDWTERFEYLQSIVTSPYAGCLDIAILYGGRYGKPYNEIFIEKYATLAAKAPMEIDYCY